MPLFYYRCANDHAQRKIQTPEEAALPQVCCKPDCATALVREPRPPSTRVTETLDNGLMTKRLERLADAERLFAERNEAVKKSQSGE
jgi:hypothetical protein